MSIRHAAFFICIMQEKWGILQSISKHCLAVGTYNMAYSIIR